MHLTPDVVITGFILVTTSLIALFLHLMRCDERPETADLERYEARHDHTRPRQMPPDPFDWMATQAIIDRDRERIASTGELRALYQRPYPGLSDTCELRALAEAGDLAGIDGILSRWASENLTEGEAA
jgi:hypothetical protein